MMIVVSGLAADLDYEKLSLKVSCAGTSSRVCVPRFTFGTGFTYK